MSRKKVVHITFDMRVGGAERVISNLVEHTNRSRHDISVVCLEQPIGPFGTELQERGYRVVGLTRRPGFDVSLIGGIRRYLIDEGIHVVHCHQYTPYIYGCLAAKSAGRRVIFTEHGRFFPDQKKVKRVMINPILCRFTDCITAISSATRESLVAFEKFPRSKIRIVYNGIEGSQYRVSRDIELQRSLGIPENAFVLGTVARLDPIKNHDMMMRALRVVRERHADTFLLIVGDGPERERLQGLARELSVASHVIFTGFREDIRVLYSIMDLFLLTSFSEGTAMTLLEAMAGSLPCIVTDVGGNPEIVENGRTGFVIPSDDDKALADRIDRFLVDTGVGREMGDAGRKRFEAEFTVEKMVREYERLYEGM